MSDESQVTYIVHVHREPEYGYWADVEELPGCFAAGETLEELWESLEEAVSLYLSSEAATTRVQIESGREVETIVEKQFLVSS